MAVVVTVVAPVTSDMYDAVSAKTMPGGQLPEGCQLHVAGPFDKDGGSLPSGTRPNSSTDSAKRLLPDAPRAVRRF